MFVILCLCWDTPSEKTGLWQLPKVYIPLKRWQIIGWRQTCTRQGVPQIHSYLISAQAQQVSQQNTFYWNAGVLRVSYRLWQSYTAYYIFLSWRMKITNPLRSCIILFSLWPVKMLSVWLIMWIYTHILNSYVNQSVADIFSIVHFFRFRGVGEGRNAYHSDIHLTACQQV